VKLEQNKLMSPQAAIVGDRLRVCCRGYRKRKGECAMRNVLKSMMVAAVAAVGLGTGAKAISVTQAFLSNSDAAMDLLRDDDRTYLINRTGGATTLDVGDSLRGMFNISYVNNISFGANPQVGTPDLIQFTAVFQVLVTGKVGSSTTGYTFTFGADPTFGTLGGDKAVYAVDTPGAVAVLYEGPNILNFMDGGGAANKELAIATATVGSRFFTLGFTGATTSVAVGSGSLSSILPSATEAWMTVVADDNLANLHLISASDAVGTTIIGIDRLSNSVAETADPVKFLPVTMALNPMIYADVTGTIDILGSQEYQPTGFDSASNAQLKAHAVPPPASVWGGAMLLGLLGISQIKRARAK